MASSTENVKLGVCTVTFGGEDLGYTKGGVEVEVTTTTHKVMVDQFGDTEIDENIMGRTVKATVPLAETTLENLVAIMPGATLVDSGATAKRVDVSTGVGISLAKIAQELVLHPINADDENDDFIIFKAATRGEVRFAYKKDEERIWAVEFTGYADETGKLFAVGDKTATAGP